MEMFQNTHTHTPV